MAIAIVAAGLFVFGGINAEKADFYAVDHQAITVFRMCVAVNFGCPGRCGKDYKNDGEAKQRDFGAHGFVPGSGKNKKGVQISLNPFRMVVAPPRLERGTSSL